MPVRNSSYLGIKLVDWLRPFIEYIRNGLALGQTKRKPVNF